MKREPVAVTTGLACGLSVVLGKVAVAGWGACDGLTTAVTALKAADTAGFGACFGASTTTEWLRAGAGWSLLAGL